MSKHAVTAAGEAMAAESILDQLKGMLEAGDAQGALSLLAAASDAPSNTFDSPFGALIEQYREAKQNWKTLFEIDDSKAAPSPEWDTYCDLAGKIIEYPCEGSGDVRGKAEFLLGDDFIFDMLENSEDQEILRHFLVSLCAPTSGTSIQILQDLINEHRRLWEIDSAVWDACSDVEDCEAANARPALRVQISRLLRGRDDDGQDIFTPIYATSLQEIDDEGNRRMKAQSVLIRKGDVARTAEVEATTAEWVASKTAEFNSIAAERKRIEDACGITAVYKQAHSSSDAVKAVERQIIDLVPVDLQTAQVKAAWIMKVRKDEVTYIDDDDVIAALESIGMAMV